MGVQVPAKRDGVALDLLGQPLHLAEQIDR
jgi:hypothetical protein